MHLARYFATSVLMPDGEIFIIGGSKCFGANNLQTADGSCRSGAVMYPEIYDPASQSWSVLSRQPTVRMYHSVALLLPDARILVAGGGRPGALGESTELKYLAHHEVEIFSPPYLFNADGSPAPRPAITSTPPDNIVYGQTFNLSVSNGTASQIQQVVLVRLPSVTHAMNFDQQRIVLGYQVVDQQTLSVTAPPNATYGPPGPYMLFVIGPNGAPSVAKIVFFANTVPVTLTATPQVSSITYGQSVSITAQLAPSVSTPTPTGTISVKEGGVVVQTATVPGGGAISLAASNLIAGTHVLTVTYSGDAIFQSATAASFIVTVNPATLTVTGNNASRLYGDANPVFIGTITGLQNGDNITASYQSSATAASVVGTYAITATLSDPGGRLSNYSVSLGSGTLTVQAAPLHVTANNKTKMYGDPIPLLDGIITGIRNADNIVPQYSTTATAQSLVGTYTITITLSDPTGKLGNYSVTLQNGILTVTRSNVALASPVFSPSDGAYSPGQTVTLTEPTSSAAAIHYTANGTTPTAASPLYTGPLVLNAATTFKAMATQPEYLDSSVSSVSYSVGIPVSATPVSQTLLSCASASYTVSVPATNGISGSLALNVSGLPAGATGSFSPATISSSGSSTLTVTTSPATPTGSYTLTISVSNSALTGGTNVSLVVQDFNLSVASSSQAVTAGTGAAYSLSGLAVNGFSGSVALSLSGLPAGASGTFSPASFIGAGASTLTVATSTSTPVGTYPLTVTGSSGCRIHTMSLTLIVNAAPPPPAITSLSISAGPVGASVTITGVNFGATQGASSVTFNGTTAQPVAWSVTSISVTVPRGATTGNVVVTAGGQASNGVAFTVQDDALHIFGVNCAGCGNQVTDFTVQSSLLYGYVIRPGDILSFYQMQSSGSVGGMILCFASGEGLCDDDGKTLDREGQRISADTVQGITHFREVDLTPNAGLMLSQIQFTSSGATQAGRWDIFYGAVQIVSADGTVHPIFMAGGSPGLFPFGTEGVTQRGSTIEPAHVW